MDIYEYAMQMEKDGETYYRSSAEKVAHKGIQNILTMLADAEVTHYRMFEGMKKEEEVRLEDTKILSTVKNIFQKMSESKDFSLIRLSEIDLYKKAQEIEKMSRDFYLEKANQITDPSQHDIFLKVAEEEKKHYLILENIIDFVSRPDQWLENPEWYHLEDY
jgi:rubrerythrin